MSGIVVQKLNHTFKSRQENLAVLNNLTFGVDSGEVVSILGPSGCGKSTLLRCIAGLLTPSTGSITIDGDTPKTLREQRQLGFGFQEPCLMAWRTVEENISLPAEIGARSISSLSGSRVDDLLEM